MNTDDRQPVVLTLVPLADDVPAKHRIKRALKCLLRSFGLKCVRITPADAADAADETTTPACPQTGLASLIRADLAARRAEGIPAPIQSPAAIEALSGHIGANTDKPAVVPIHSA